MNRRNFLAATAPAIAALLSAGPALANDPVLIRSDAVTFHFGIDAAVPGLDPIFERHVDLSLGFSGTTDVFGVDADGPFSGQGLPAGIYDASTVYLHGPPTTAYTHTFPIEVFPTGQPDDTFYRLAQGANPFIFLGINTENLSTAQRNEIASYNAATLDHDPSLEPGASVWADAIPNLSSQWLRLELADVRGPAGEHFSLYRDGGPVVFSTYEPGETGSQIDESDRFYMTPSTHEHFNWGFSAAGLWELDFQVSVRRDNVLPGDANLDGVVDLLDFDVLAQSFGRTADTAFNEGDFTNDFGVDLLDFDALAQNFGTASPAAVPGAVPQPGALAGLALGLVALRRRR